MSHFPAPEESTSVTDQLNAISQQLATLTTKYTEISDKVNCIQFTQLSSQTGPQTFRHVSDDGHDDDGGASPAHVTAPGHRNITDSDIPSVDGLLQDFEQLRKSLERIKIDKKLTFSRERTGIKREDQRTFNVICKCATIAETVAKIVQSLEPKDVTTEQLDQIFLCAATQLGYLREESAALFVKGEYGPTTARLYRHMTKHTVMNPENVEILRSAAQLAAIQDQFSGNRNSNTRGRGRGVWRGNYYGQGQGNTWRNPFARYSNRGVGYRRPDFQHGATAGDQSYNESND